MQNQGTLTKTRSIPLFRKPDRLNQSNGARARDAVCVTVATGCYALQLEERAWVLHAFQKKAKQGIKTPKKDIDLIGERLKRLKKELRQ